MALGDWLGTIGWRTEVDTTGAEAGVHKAESEVRESLNRIDGMEAYAKAGIQLRELERDAAKVRATIAALNREKIEIQAKLEATEDKGWQTRYARELKNVNDQLKVYGQHQKEIGSQTSMLRTTRAQTKAIANEVEATNKLTAAREKELQQIPKLRLQYARLAAQRNKIADKRSFMRTTEDVVRLEAIGTEMDQLRTRIESTGGSIDGLDDNVEDHRTTLRRWGASIANIRVHMGIMSLTLRQAGIALVTLGPMLMNVVGAASALVGVVGAGLVGAVGAGAAGLTAMGLATFGLVQAFKPAAAEFGSAMDALNAYDEAVMEHGKNSQEAREAQKALNETMKNISPAAAEAARAFDQVRDKFIELTKPTRANIFKMMADGFERLKSLTPDFARNINRISGQLRVAGSEFLRMWDADEMGTAMNRVLGNFAAVLPTLGRAFGNIGEALGRVFAEFSTHFDDIADGLLKWSEGFVNATRDSQGLTETIDGLMDSAGTLMDFLGSAGDLLTTFFGAGQEAGRSLMDDMTGTMDRWVREMEADPTAIRDWFKTSVEGAKDLWNALAPIGSAFLDIVDAMQPFTTAILAGFEAVAKLVNVLMNIPGAGGLMTVLGGLLGGKLLYKAMSGIPILGAGIAALGSRAAVATRSLASTVPVVGTLGAATAKTGATVAKTGKTFTDSAGKLRYMNGQFAPATAAATTAGSAMAKTAGTAGMLGSTMLRGASTFLRFAGPVGLVASTALLAADAFGLFGSSTDEAQEGVDQMNAQLQQMTVGLKDQAGGAIQARQMMLQYENALRSGGKAAQQASMAIRQSFNQQRAEIQQSMNAARSTIQKTFDTDEWSNIMDNVLDDGTLADFAGRLDDMGLSLDDFKRSMEQTGKISGRFKRELLAAGAEKDEIRALNALLGDSRRNIQAAAEAASKLRFDKINVARMKADLDKLPQSMRGVVDKIEQAFGPKRTMRWAVEADTAKAQGQLLQLLNWARQNLSKQQVIRIMAKSDNAEEAIRRLGRIKDEATKPVTLRARDGVSGPAGRAQAKVKAIPKDWLSVFKGNDDVSPKARDATNAINRVPKNHNTKIDGDASGAVSAAAAAVQTISAMRAVISVVANVVGNALGFGGRAEGGPLVPGYASGGGYINKPMFIVGEEAPRHPEFVIATNPAYKQSNLAYWEAAGKALGVQNFARGGYRSGGIPINKAQREYDQSDRAHDKAKERSDKAEGKLKDLRKKRKPPAPASEINHWEREVKRSERELRQTERKRDRAKANLKAVKQANKAWENLDAQIQRAANEMDAASATGNVGGFNAWKEQQVAGINELIRKLQRAAKDAGGQHKTELLSRIASLTTQRASVQEQRPGMTGMLSNAESRELARIEQQIAEAGLTSGITDDREAGARLTSFWESVYGRLRGSGAAPEFITEAANRLREARERSIDGGAGGITGSGQVFNTAREDLYRSFGSNVIWRDAAVSPYSTSPGPSGGSQVQVTNNFSQPPADPHTWSEQQSYELSTMGV